jgi:hypothetical protein
LAGKVIVCQKVDQQEGEVSSDDSSFLRQEAKNSYFCGAAPTLRGNAPVSTRIVGSRLEPMPGWSFFPAEAVTDFLN